ncbi:enzyme activator [Arthroderma uncinatum]|uniref:enzyme activator n=1 Tax=Arthroderma uncinatum TaxID=74035 RepID=UPI00144A9F86|nr:enzyme activator [Arthroderma uncinatum]KAF3490702.1 enzyme activator [Arthroderma uncinatum]
MAYQTRPPPRRGPPPGPGPQYGGRPPQQYPPPDRRLPHAPGANGDRRPMNYDDGYGQRDPYARGGRGMYEEGPPPQNRAPRGPPPPQGYRGGPPNGHHQPPQPPQGAGPAPGPGRLQNKPPPVRQYSNQVPPKPQMKSSFDNPFPSFPPRQRGNSIDFGLEKKMSALELNQNYGRGEQPVVRPHTSNSNRPPPSTHYSEPLPPLNSYRAPSDNQPIHRKPAAPLSVETHHTAPPALQSPQMAPPSRSATMPVNMSTGGPKPLYPGQRTWQDPCLSPGPLSPALRPDTNSVSSRPGTAPGVKPELVHPNHTEPEAQVADKVEGDDDLNYLTEDLLNDYYDSTEPNEPNEPDMPNFGAMSDDNAGSQNAETLIPFDKPVQDAAPKPAYAAYKPTAGIPPPQPAQERQGPQNGFANHQHDRPPSPGYANGGYNHQQPGDGYYGRQDPRSMTPVQRGGYGGGRGGYPPQHYQQYGPPPPENGGRGQYDNRQAYPPHDSQYGGPRPGEDQYGGYQNPDALPHHPHPTPFRPGLEQGPKPAPVRQYTTPQPVPTPQPSQAPASYGGDDRRASQPITLGELHALQQAARSNPSDHAQQLVLVKKLVEAAIHLIDDNGRADAKTKAKNRERYTLDAYKIAKKLVSAGYPPAMFYMADCYGSGQLGLEVNPKEAFGLYQSAAKMGHAESAYRLAVCCEMGQEGGGGTRRDPMKAVQWYRRAASLGDPPAMYKMGMILLKGLLGQPKNPREALSWLKRAAERADEDNPHALHELALLYENPQGNNAIIQDENYARELLHQAGELGYKFSQHRLGAAYEYGLVGCPVDPRQSIYWYTQAAAQGEHQSELSLSGWYLTGAEGILQQSDTEAYLWARKAAMAGLAKAEYAMGYFTEVGIGVPTNLDDAKRWYWKASSQNFLKARERLEELRRGGAKMQKTRVSRSAVNKNEGDCIVM